jgi:hypothetical protein
LTRRAIEQVHLLLASYQAGPAAHGVRLPTLPALHPRKRDGMRTVSFQCCSLLARFVPRVWNKVDGPCIALKGTGGDEGNDDAQFELA